MGLCRFDPRNIKLAIDVIAYGHDPSRDDEAFWEPAKYAKARLERERNGSFADTIAPGTLCPADLMAQNFFSLIWDTAELLRGNNRQSDCGKVILPFTLLRRLDCVLEKMQRARATTKARDDARIVEEIRHAQRRYRGRYGRRRMTPEIREALGRAVNYKRIGRLMREHGLCGRKRRPFRVVTTDSRHEHPIAPNVVQRDFTTTAPNRKWFADITCGRTDEAGTWRLCWCWICSRARSSADTRAYMLCECQRAELPKLP